jgi:PilZ domain-containing protein
LAEEVRRQHRIGVALELHIRGAGRDGIAFAETTHSNDVSRGGCSFPLTREVAFNSVLEIEIVRHSTGSQSSFLTTATVLRVIPVPPEGWTVGVRFIGPQFPTYSRENTAA